MHMSKSKQDLVLRRLTSAFRRIISRTDSRPPLITCRARQHRLPHMRKSEARSAPSSAAANLPGAALHHHPPPRLARSAPFSCAAGCSQRLAAAQQLQGWWNRAGGVPVGDVPVGNGVHVGPVIEEESHHLVMSTRCSHLHQSTRPALNA